MQGSDLPRMQLCAWRVVDASLCMAEGPWHALGTQLHNGMMGKIMPCLSVAPMQTPQCHDLLQILSFCGHSTQDTAASSTSVTLSAPCLTPVCLAPQAREADLLQQLASLQACIKPKYLSKARMRAAQHKAAAQPDSTASLQASASFKGKNPPKPPVSPSPTEESPRPSQNLSEGSPRPSPGPKEGATIPAQSPGSSRSSQSYEAALPNGWTVQQPNGVYENHH